MSKRSSRSIRSRRQAEKSKQSQILLLIGISVGAVLVVAGIILLSSPGNNTVGAIDETFYEGLEQSIDQQGAIGFAIGDPGAPVTIVEYSDFSCPHCFDLSKIMHEVIDTYVRDGDVRIVYKPVAFLSPYSEIAAQYAICAGQQDKFWQMHYQIWGVFETYGASVYGSRLSERALDLDTGQFRSCLNSAETRSTIQDATEEFRTLGEGNDRWGTPVIYINGTYSGFTGEDYLPILEAEIKSRLGQ